MSKSNSENSLRSRHSDEELLAMCKQLSENTLVETLDIEYEEIGADYLIASMLVTPKVHMPDGVLHGGASIALAETVGSVASYIFLDSKNFYIRGVEISGNHLRSISEGKVYARAEFIHRGRTLQLTDIKISDECGRLISSVKLTTIALKKPMG